MRGSSRMGRGSATEDELSAGIRSVGVVARVTGAEGSRRDNALAPSPTPPKVAPSERTVAAPAPEARPAARSVGRPPRKLEEEPLRPSIEPPSSESNPYTDYVTVPMSAEMRSQA